MKLLQISKLKLEEEEEEEEGPSNVHSTGPTGVSTRPMSYKPSPSNELNRMVIAEHHCGRILYGRTTAAERKIQIYGQRPLQRAASTLSGYL